MITLISRCIDIIYDHIWQHLCIIGCKETYAIPNWALTSAPRNYAYNCFALPSIKCPAECREEPLLGMSLWDSRLDFLIVTAKTRYWFIWHRSGSMSESKQWNMNYIRNVMQVNSGNNPGITSGRQSYFCSNHHLKVHIETNHRPVHFARTMVNSFADRQEWGQQY